MICPILYQFNLYILLILGKKLERIEIFLLNFSGVKTCAKMAISAYILEKSGKADF